MPLPKCTRIRLPGFHPQNRAVAFLKPNTINRLPKIITENFPNRTRTEPRDEIGRRTPGELRKLNFWETGEPRVLESGPEWRDFRPAWGLGAGGETGPEAVNVAAWGGESGRGPARGGRSRVPKGVGGAELLESGHSINQYGSPLSAQS